VLPSRRPPRPSRRVGNYDVDIDLRRTARGAVSFVVLGIVGVVLGIVLTVASLAALVWLYQSWLAPSLGS